MQPMKTALRSFKSQFQKLGAGRDHLVRWGWPCAATLVSCTSTITLVRLLVFSDIHGDLHALEKLMAAEADYYFAAGDLATWSRGLEKAAPLLKPKADRVYVMPGNHESERDIALFCSEHGFQEFHGRVLTLNGWHVAGLGYSTPT